MNKFRSTLVGQIVWFNINIVGNWCCLIHNQINHSEVQQSKFCRHRLSLIKQSMNGTLSTQKTETISPNKSDCFVTFC